MVQRGMVDEGRLTVFWSIHMLKSTFGDGGVGYSRPKWE